MSYLELVKRALNGRSVNAAAKQWGIPQSTLDRYAKGIRLPDPLTAQIIAREAGITSGEMLDAMAEEQQRRLSALDKMSASFNTLLRSANAYWTGFRRVA